MKIRTGKYSSIEEAGDYLDHLASTYLQFNGYDYFIGDIKKALQYTITSIHQNAEYIVLSEGEKILAHTLLVEDDRLPQGEALFGFFECKNSNEVFLLLWNKLSELCRGKGISVLKGPINATIWHQYRVIKKSDSKVPFFNSEPLGMPWYYTMLQGMNPVEEVNYHSGLREQFDLIIDLTKPSYDALVAEGYSIKPGEINPEQIAKLYRLSAGIFTDSWSFTKIDEKEFASLYSGEKIEKHIGEIYMAYQGNSLAGFCSTVRDHNNLIMKTIAVLPRMQGMGIGNALVHLVHREAKNNGISAIVYALIRDINKVRFFPKDDVILFREYACFTFSLHGL